MHLDVAAANAHIGPWLADVANVRTHATTGERPDRRLALERTALMPLPSTTTPGIEATTRLSRPTPIESLQHPLSIYQALLQEVRP